VRRDEPRRRDWWLVGCAVFAVALATSTAVVVVSDEGMTHSRLVAPGLSAATPAPSHLLSVNTEPAPQAQPETRGIPGATRTR
jgi:hypothetical protein